MSDPLHREACVNFETVLAGAKRAFDAGDLDSARRRLEAAQAVIARVQSRKSRAA